MAFLDNYIKVQKKGDFKDIRASYVKKDYKDYSIMSMHTGFKQSDFTPIIFFKEEDYSGDIFEITFTNNFGREREICCTEDSQFYTLNKGWVDSKNLKKSYVFFDNEECFNKLLNIEKVEVVTKKTYSLNSEYNKNYFYGGILVR